MENIEALRAAKLEAERRLVDCVDAGGPDYDDPIFQERATEYKAACEALATALAA
jgi:hypothetical protein